MVFLSLVVCAARAASPLAPRAALAQELLVPRRTVAVTVCARNRYHWGETTDDACRVLIDGDRLPTWGPDGRHFVTARQMGGVRFDANGFAVRSEAVMLHDREDLGNPHVLLIADQGGISGAIDDFTWSPDGHYVLYTLHETTDAANVWWIDVLTGATGRVTHAGPVMTAPAFS